MAMTYWVESLLLMVNPLIRTKAAPVLFIWKAGLVLLVIVTVLPALTITVIPFAIVTVLAHVTVPVVTVTVCPAIAALMQACTLAESAVVTNVEVLHAAQEFLGKQRSSNPKMGSSFLIIAPRPSNPSARPAVRRLVRRLATDAGRCMACSSTVLLVS
jgi:hypothetical protein